MTHVWMLSPTNSRQSVLFFNNLGNELDNYAPNYDPFLLIYSSVPWRNMHL